MSSEHQRESAKPSRPWTIARLVSFRGTIGRGGYAAAGVSLIVVKYLIDSVTAGLIAGRAWSPLYYVGFEQIELLRQAGPEDVRLFAGLLVVAVPFVWVGVALTVQRLRDVGWPVWLAMLFFVPFLSFAICLALCVMPPAGTAGAPRAAGATSRPKVLTEWLPVRTVYSAPLSVVITAVLGLGLTGFNIAVLGVYGLGLFVGLPFALGVMAAILFGMGSVRDVKPCVGVALAAVFVVGGLMFVTSIEGGICLLMAAPIWMVVAVIGGIVGYLVQRFARDELELAVAVMALIVAVPALMGAEYVFGPPAPVFAVRSEVEISAPRERVWSHVVTFPPLGEPEEAIFQTGLAYPIGASIDGQGVGAERRCRFSTGDFIEPIEVWDEPALLRFSVTENPPPMEEWSIYGAIQPRHLHGYFIARAGQFRLVAAAEGITRLEGTTWYQHHMRPAGYWRIYSDYIVHRIHLRVLEHIKALCESEPGDSGGSSPRTAGVTSGGTNRVE